MTNTELFDELMTAYAVTAEEVQAIAGPENKLAGAVLRSHSVGFLRVLVSLLEPVAKESKFKQNVELVQ